MQVGQGNIQHKIMKLYSSNIKQETDSDDWDGIIPEPSIPIKILEHYVDYPTDSLFYHKIYLASDFSDYITGLDKTYLCVYSSDHDVEGSYWATFSEKDWSDWEVKGRMFLYDSSTETPVLQIINGKLHLYVHPVNSPQQTDLWIANAKPISLDYVNQNSNWQKYDNPLGLHTLANGNQIEGVDESHTGYMGQLATRSEGDGLWTNPRTGNRFIYRCGHGAVTTSGALNRSRVSYSNDGITFERGESNFPKHEYENNQYRSYSTQVVDNVYFENPETYFPRYSYNSNYNYGFGSGGPNSNIPRGTATTTEDRARVHVIQSFADGYENGRRWLRYAWQDTADIEYRNYLMKIYPDDPNTAHFYLVNHRDNGDVYYATWDITFLAHATPDEIERAGNDVLDYDDNIIK